MICPDFESILVPKDNGKQNPNESYTNKYQNMLFVVVAINQYVLMINLVSPSNHTMTKVLFTTLLAV